MKPSRALSPSLPYSYRAISSSGLRDSRQCTCENSLTRFQRVALAWFISPSMLLLVSSSRAICTLLRDGGAGRSCAISRAKVRAPVRLHSKNRRKGAECLIVYNFMGF